MTNMFKPTKARNVKEYIDALPPERKDTILFLHTLIQKQSPKLKAHFAYNMLGYGKFRYVNYKKETIDWPVVALASQKHHISIYICALEKGKYLAEKYKKQLGKVSVGKSCIRFKKLADVNLPALKEVIKKAAKNPGLTP
ncbi:DUF1801 domain-containing protein [Candidatus Woesearchaeota archaeon]|nr:MAG: DUF1801 domain-containing protein [Candidatus Woesearchaeota archaeon]